MNETCKNRICEFSKKCQIFWIVIIQHQKSEMEDLSFAENGIFRSTISVFAPDLLHLFSYLNNMRRSQLSTAQFLIWCAKNYQHLPVLIAYPWHCNWGFEPSHFEKTWSAANIVHPDGNSNLQCQTLISISMEYQSSQIPTTLSALFVNNKMFSFSLLELFSNGSLRTYFFSTHVLQVISFS